MASQRWAIVSRGRDDRLVHTGRVNHCVHSYAETTNGEYTPQAREKEVEMVHIIQLRHERRYTRTELITVQLD